MLSRLYRAVMTSVRRNELLVCIAVIILGIAVGGHLYGHYLSHRDILERDNTIQQLQAAGQKLNQEITALNAKLTALQAKLAGVEAAFEAIVPSANTYNFSPNQSMIVADGRLTVGLIGSPTNEGINININGKQQSVAAGDVIKIALDPSTACQVAVQSFDMFKALITASCAAVKPQETPAPR